MNTKMKMRMLSLLLCFVMLVGLMPTSVFAAGTKLETPQNLKLQGTVLSWDAVDNADFYGITLYHPNYVYSIGSWQTDGTSINLYKYLKDGETYGATVIACSNGSYQISTPAEIPLTACTNAGVPIYRDVNVVNGTSSASTAYPGMSVRLEAKPAPDGMVFDRWELSGGYINIGYSDTDTVIYVQAICDNDISARATYKYQENVTSAFTVQPQGGAALVGESFDVTYAMNFTPQGTVKVQVEGNTPGDFTDLKQGEIDSASIKEDSVVTKTFRIMASDGTRNIYSDEFVVSWEDGPRFVSQPMGGTVDHNVDFVATYALNFTPFSCRVERYNDYLGQWSELSFASATQATISSYDFNTSSIYRIKAIIEGGGEVYSDEFTVTWSDAVSKFIQQPIGGTVGFDEDFTFTFAINFTPVSNVAIQKYNSGFDSWDMVGYCTSLTSGTISGFASETTNKYRLEAYEKGTPIHSNEFTVTWEGTDYTVSFAANGGSGTMADVNNVSGEYTLPACGFTAPNGQRFKAWLVGGNEKAVDDKITVTANTTVTAVWENIPVTYYTVTFDSNGGSAVTAQTIEEGQKATKPADPTKAYYAFDGWYSDSNLTQAFDFNTPITGDTTIYAKWDVVITAANATVTVPVAGEHPDFNPISGDSSRYTVAFETWYLHESPYPDLDANSVFEHGKSYSLRIRFTPNAGYQFDSNTVFTVNGKATTSFGGIGAREYSATAYAATYTVTYDANGGTGSMAQEFLTHDNDGFAKNYTFPQCGFTSPAGQEFDKWLWYYESNPGSTNEITPGQSPWIYGNIVVKALWKTAEYNVTVTGGTASVGAGTPITKATMGTTVTLIAGQAPAGQEFDKWVVNGVVVADANSATTTFVMPAGNVTATATYKNISVGNHPVTIAMKDGDDVNSAYTDVQDLALELLAYKGLLVEDAQVTGFRNNVGKLLFTMNNNFIVLQDGLTEQDYIHYTLTPQEVAEIKSYYGADITEVHLTFPSKCVVSFETNGGSSVSKLNLYIGDKVTKPADPTKPYFALAGWYSDSGLTQAFDFNQPITGDITLYAKWTPSPVGGMFLMTIDFNGGTSTMPTVGEVPANSGIYLNDNLGNFVTPPSGKVLAGYEIDGVPYAAGGDYLVTQNFTLKFLWKEAPVTTYTVSFNANGGSGTMADVTGISGEYTLPSNGFTAPNGKKFKAWSVGGVEKTAGAIITVNANTTVTAVWEKIPVTYYTVTFDSNGGSAVTAQTIEEGQKATKPADPTKAGYDFKGWTLNGSAYDFNTAVNGDITLVATWEQQQVVPTTYTVSFAANGGTGTMADVTGISGEYTLPANGFTAPDGKQFKAWSVGGVEKAIGDKITVTTDTTVTAVWETIPAGHTCDIKPVANVEPSCTEGGKEAYYKCEGCGKFYEDALGAKEITDLAAWGNIAKNGHTESDWKSDKDNHWKECTVAACGVIIENSKAAHADANNDGKCDTCEYNVGTTTTNPNNKPSDDTTKPEDTNKPSDDVQSPQTGDNSMMWLWVALLFVSGFGVVATTVIGKKRTSAK